MRVVQYIAYFPPHVWGLESHAAQRAQRWVKEWCGDCLVATYSVGQTASTQTYERDGYTVVVIPAFEIIPTFPFPKFWTAQYRQAHHLIKQFAPDILITRTRFFPTSLFGGIFAKWHRIKRVHIEHGVAYVRLNTRWKNIIAWCYDQTVWRLIFHCADQVIGISEGCKRFVERFVKRPIPVIHRGVIFSPAPPTRDPSPTTCQLWFVGRLTKLKGVDTILEAFHLLNTKGIDHFHLTLVGDGEEKEALQLLTKQYGLQEQVTFLGMRDQTYLAQTFYPSMHIIINASLQEGLPTSVVEWLLAKCIVVATAVGGTPEISDQADLLLTSPGDAHALADCLKKAIEGHMVHAGISYDMVLHRFDWSQNIMRYQTCLSEVYI
jgi:glycosyltransferase involved in cell wall biosynthesis